jgi:hypothetical protein
VASLVYFGVFFAPFSFSLLALFLDHMGLGFFLKYRIARNMSLVVFWCLWAPARAVACLAGFLAGILLLRFGVSAPGKRTIISKRMQHHLLVVGSKRTTVCGSKSKRILCLMASAQSCSLGTPPSSMAVNPKE